MANPTPGSRPGWVSDELFPFQSRFLELRGHVLHYVDEGNGPVLLMYHGNPSWSFLYRDIIAALRDEFRCVAFDYPGMGLSTAAAGFTWRAGELADVAEAFVARLDLHGITPMVQDWGGPVGLAAAVRQPERYRAVIIGNTWGWPAATWHEKLVHRSFAALWGGPAGRFAIDRGNQLAKTVLTPGHKRRPRQPEEMAQYLAPFRHPGSRTPSMSCRAKSSGPEPCSARSTPVSPAWPSFPPSFCGQTATSPSRTTPAAAGSTCCPGTAPMC